MEKEQIRMSDIAQELGLSTATVSNVIHGKELIEKRGYMPNMAEILLAQNNSRIIGVVVNDHEKYEGHVLEDGFIAASVNALSRETDLAGYFMMVKVTAEWDEIARFASNIPFVVYDGYFEEAQGICNLTIDNYDGGCQVGRYLKRMGHQRILCIADNAICMDAERMKGCAAVLGESSVVLMQIPMQEKERRQFYREKKAEILSYTAVFAVSDFYAVELIRFLQENHICVPEDISIVGFDDSPLCKYSLPALTTVRQDAQSRAQAAIQLLQKMKSGTEERIAVKLPVFLVERSSVKNILNQNKSE